MPEISDHVKQQAMNAVAAVRHEITNMRQAGSVEPPQATPNPSLSQKVGERIAQMQKSGYDVDRIHSEVTKDNFVR